MSDTPNPRSQYQWLFPLSLIVAGLLAYYNSLSGAMVFDDHVGIINDQFVRRFEPWSALFSGHRPFLRLTLAINHYVGGLQVFGYHLFNVVIHILAALALFGIIRQTMRQSERVRSYSDQATTMAFVMALLWLVHPLQTGSVTYIIQRAESLMGLLYLACLYFVLRGAWAARFTWGWYGAAVIAFTLGIATKEVIATASVVILLYDRIFLVSSWREVLKKRWIVYLIMFSPGLVWMIINMLPALIPASLSSLAQSGLRATAGFNTPNITPLDYASTQPGVLIHYLKLVFWPDPLVLDYNWNVSDPYLDVLAPALMIGVLVLATIFLLVRRPAAGFLAACFFIILAPTSSIMPILDPIFEHRMYLSLAPVLILAVSGVHILMHRLVPEQRTRFWIQGLLVGAVALGLTWRTVARNADYQDPITIWQKTVSVYPANQRAHLNLGVAYNRAGQTEKAIEHYLTATRLKSQDPITFYNLGFALQEVGRHMEASLMYSQVFEVEVHRSVVAKAYNQLGLIALTTNNMSAALDFFQKSVRAYPTLALSQSNLALVYIKQANYQAAKMSLDEALKVQPNFPVAHYQRGVALEGLNDIETAIESYARASALKPDYHEALQRLDRLKSQQMNAEALAMIVAGKTQEALAAFNTALEQDPTNHLVYNNLGNTYLLLKQADKAIEYYQASLRIEPDQPEPMSNIAWVLATHPDETIRNPEEAMDLAEQACRLAEPPGPALLDTRAAAYAATGGFGKAVADMRRAIRLAENQKMTDPLPDYRARLALYRRNQPYYIAQ